MNSRGKLTNLTCNPCPFGTFSSPLRDDTGLTYVCKPCAPGSAQAEAASLECEPCPRGEFQESSGAAFCQRCPRGTYQDVNGQRSCLACPTGTTTLGLASMSVIECVCVAGTIEEDGKCRLCSLGMFCPKGSTVALLLNHSSGIEDELPYLRPGFTSSPSSPLKIYKCPQEFCPGGMPGNCSGDRVGLTCGGCAVGTYPSAVGSCSTCQDENLPLWTACFLVLGVAFLVVYYYLTSQSQSYNPQASVSTVVVCLVGLAFNMFQNVAVISAAPTAWPPLLISTVHSGRILTLNVEVIGLSCIFAGPGSVLLKYLAQAAAFPLVICVILLVFVFTRLLAKAGAWGGHPFATLAWTWHGTVSLIGKFCHCTFPTMVNISLIPFMCYAHPDGEESLVKFTDTFCWEGGDHLLMMVAGAILAGLSLVFFSLCSWSAWKVADWNPRSQAACKFMVEDFRPDMLWFGMVTLCRGLLLSLPAVMASNMATLQLVLLHSVMIGSLAFQSGFQPWKSPALNLFDTLSQCMFVTLLGVGLGGLTDNEETNDVLERIGSIICILLLVFFGALLVAFMLTFTFDKLLNHGIGKRLINLGVVPSPRVVFFLLRKLAKRVEENKWQKSAVVTAMGSLGTQDLREVLSALAILELEVGLNKSSTRRIGRSSLDSILSSASQLNEAKFAKHRVFEGQSALTKRRASRRVCHSIKELQDDASESSDSGSEEVTTERVEVKSVDDQSNLSHSSKATFDPMVEFHI